jgi:hypothetical protein
MTHVSSLTLGSGSSLDPARLNVDRDRITADQAAREESNRRLRVGEARNFGYEFAHRRRVVSRSVEQHPVAVLAGEPPAGSALSVSLRRLTGAPLMTVRARSAKSGAKVRSVRLALPTRLVIDRAALKRQERAVRLGLRVRPLR